LKARVVEEEGKEHGFKDTKTERRSSNERVHVEKEEA
jgi:hypothetical protein